METKEEAQALIGRVLDGKYRLEALIGRGGFGVVYRARHLIWDQPVAIKVLTKLTNVDEGMREEVLDAFVREGRLLSALSSRTTGIVQARDIGTMVTEAGLWMPYMVLEWLEGEPLGRILKRDRWAGEVTRSAGEVFQIFDGVARALAVAHANNVAHRDIKPPNIVVLGGRLEPGAVIKLLDFGIAKVMQSHSGQALEMTTSKKSIFTPFYGAPEQYDRSLGASGPWTDVFAMALVIVELMIGRRVFSGQSFIELSCMCLDPDARPTPRNLGAEVDDAVEAVFARALAIRIEDRFRTMGDFWLAMVEALGIERYPPLALEILTEGESAPSSPEWSSAALSASQPRPGESLESLRALDSQARELGQSRTGPQSSGTHPATATAKATAKEKASMPGRRGHRGLVFGAGLLLVGAGLAYLSVGGEEDDTEVAARAERVDPETPKVGGPTDACPEGMVRIEGSSYFMGSDAEGVPALALARPAHKVEVGDFCLDRTEVTVAAYRTLSEVGECKRAYADAFWPRGEAEEEEDWKRLRAAYSPLCNGVDAKRDEHPVNCVTWSQADDYCRLVGKRLPSEAEWEFAARGRDGRVFPWGDEPPTGERINGCGVECRAWLEAAEIEATPTLYESDDGYAGTSPVGSFPKGKTEAGLVDMIGNVFEWTADAYRPYDQEGEGDPSRRVIRGGAFNSFQAEHANPALRYPMAAEAHSHGIGFRCAASITQREP